MIATMTVAVNVIVTVKVMPTITANEDETSDVKRSEKGKANASEIVIEIASESMNESATEYVMGMSHQQARHRPRRLGIVMVIEMRKVVCLDKR